MFLQKKFLLASTVCIQKKNMRILNIVRHACRLRGRISHFQEHTFYKYWSGTSSAMEADIIFEGFLQNMPLYGVKFFCIIGDGDSNVYKKVLGCRPYDNLTVEKVECKNHL